MFTYNLDKLRHDLREGVSVVGNASSIRNHDYAERIDSKFTVRFNTPLHEPQFTGKRKDVVMIGCKVIKPLKLVDYRKIIFRDTHNIFNPDPSNIYKTKSNFFNTEIMVFPSLAEHKDIFLTQGGAFLNLLDKMQIKKVSVYGYDFKETSSRYGNTIYSSKSRKKTKHNYAAEKPIVLEMIERNGWEFL